MKFDKLVEQILNENNVSIMDAQTHPTISLEHLKNSKDSVGWSADGEVVEGNDWLNQFEEDSDYGTTLEEFYQDSYFPAVTFEEGKREVLNYAQEYGAEEDDINILSSKLDELQQKYPQGKFFLFGLESDLALGVC